MLFVYETRQVENQMASGRERQRKRLIKMIDGGAMEGKEEEGAMIKLGGQLWSTRGI